MLDSWFMNAKIWSNSKTILSSDIESLFLYTESQVVVRYIYIIWLGKNDFTSCVIFFSKQNFMFNIYTYLVCFAGMLVASEMATISVHSIRNLTISSAILRVSLSIFSTLLLKKNILKRLFLYKVLVDRI